MTDNPRYQGRRFLRLLELYVLWSIGSLKEEDAQLLLTMTPRLQKTFSCQGTWQECIAHAMEFPANMPDLIRERWDHNVALALANCEVLRPDDFATMFVDANFEIDAIDPTSVESRH